MPEMLGCLTNAGEGGKTRFSCSTDSMVDDMLLLLRGLLVSANTITRLTPCKEHGHRAPRPAMKTIKKTDLIQSIADALQFISYYHPRDYLQALSRAYEREQSPAAKDAIAQILTNSRLCAEGHRPICQDTGIVNVFLKVGMRARFDFDEALEDVVNEGVRRAYLDAENPLRASVLTDVLGSRKNTRDNTPAVTHVQLVPGNTVAIDVAAI